MEKSDIVKHLIRYKAIQIRDFAAGEEPFEYSSGHHGPGYCMIKGLVSQRALLAAMVGALVPKVLDAFPDIEYVAGNATGGMIPAYVLAEKLGQRLGREVPYFYVRNTRKIGGHKELITGDQNNSFFVPGRRGLVLEELTNFAVTTCNSAIVQREAGYDVRHAATLVDYNHQASRDRLNQNGVTLTSLLTVHDILDLAEAQGALKPHLVADYRAFLSDPIAWQIARGIPLPSEKKEAAA